MSNFFWFRDHLYIPTFGKTFIVVPFVVPEVLGGCFYAPLPDAIKLSEKADAINR